MAKTPLNQSVTCTGLFDSLPYAEEATTSRVVVNNDLLRVVDFVFDAGQQLTEHASPKAVVCTLMEGEMDFSVKGEPHRLQVGDVIFLAPNDRHALTAVSPCRLRLVMVETEPQGSEHQG